MNSDIGWTSSARSDVGMVRELNEDSFLDRPEAGLWAVADGMGGHTAGDVASQMIRDRLAELEPAADLAAFVEQVEECLIDVNRSLRAIAARRDAHTIGSTVVAMLARGRHAACLWVGDSRLYRWRHGEIEQISQDHALVEELVAKGVLTRDQAEGHPQANLVTRAVGATDDLLVDVEIVELDAGDRFVLCSDGLDKEVGPDEIAATLGGPGGQPFSDLLVDLALSRGSRDNVTVITVEIGTGDDARMSAEERDQDDDEDNDEDTVPGLVGASEKAGAP